MIVAGVMSELDEKNLQNQGIPQDADAYINYYGLKGDPFNPNSSLFFATPQLEKMLRLFNYLAQFSRKLVVVTGDAGAGKTALLENFVNEQDAQELVCFFTALSTDTPKQVLYEIASQLGIDTVADSESLEQIVKDIRDYSLQRLEQGKNCIVVIDDAHLFETHVLEQIYLLAFDNEGQRGAISLLLGGQQLLLELVQSVIPSELVTKVLFHQQINPLSYDEMLQYLKLHFKENAGHSKPPFSGADYQHIYQQSEGLPGLVNEKAKEVLTGGLSRLVSNVEGNKKPKGFIVLVAIILLAAGGLFWWQSGSQTVSQKEIAGLEMTGQVERLEGIPKADSNDLQDEQIFAKPEQQLVAQDPSENVIDADIAELPLSLDEGPSLVASVLQEELSASDVKDVVLVEGFTEAVSVGVIELVDDESVTDKIETATAPLPEEGQTVVAEVPASAFQEQEQFEPQEQDTIAQSVKPASRLVMDAERILAFDPAEYTLQLLGSRKEESIVASMAKIPGNENMLYFEKTYKGAPWYVLIYGHYADRASADAQAAKLTAELKGIKPWVRSMSGIQDTLKANQ